MNTVITHTFVEPWIEGIPIGNGFAVDASGALEMAAKWLRRYEHQGYYFTTGQERVSLIDAANMITYLETELPAVLIKEAAWSAASLSERHSLLVEALQVHRIFPTGVDNTNGIGLDEALELADEAQLVLTRPHSAFENMEDPPQQVHRFMSPEDLEEVLKGTLWDYVEEDSAEAAASS